MWGGESKKALREEYTKLNPAGLKREITRLQDKLRKVATMRWRLRRKELNHEKQSRRNHKDFEYILREATNHLFK